MMRRATGVLLSMLLLNAVSLRSGVFCELAAPAAQPNAAPGAHALGGHQLSHGAGHEHEAPTSQAPHDGPSGPENSASDHGSLSQCVLMLLCAQSSVATARVAVAAAAPASPRVLVLTTRAPKFLSAPPEPPPPKR